MLRAIMVKAMFKMDSWVPIRMEMDGEMSVLNFISLNIAMSSF